MNKIIITLSLFATLLSACNMIPNKKDVTIKSYQYTIKDNHVNMVVDCDTNSDGVADIVSIPVAISDDALRVSLGFKDSLNVTGILVEYGDHSAIERVYVK